MTTPRRLPRDAFADRLATLAPADFAAFVAALFRARGFRVEGDGSTRRLRRDGSVPDERTMLAVSDASIPTEVEDLDCLVAARRSAALERLAADAGADVFGPEELYDLLLFGVDRETADALCREHLDRSVFAEPHERARSERRSTTQESDVGIEEGVSGDTSASWRDLGPAGADRRDRTPAPVEGQAGHENAIWNRVRSRRRLLTGLVVLAVLAVAVASASGGFEGPTFSSPLSTVDAGEPGTTTPTTASQTDTESTTGATTHVGRMVAPTSRTDRDGSTPERRFVELSPTCERPPELVAVIIVGALRENDPATDDGVRTAWNFSSRASPGATYRSFESYLAGEEFEPLYAYRGMEMTTLYAEHGDRAYRVSVTDSEGTRANYLIALTEQQGGRLPGCWLLAGIVTEW